MKKTQKINALLERKTLNLLDTKTKQNAVLISLALIIRTIFLPFKINHPIAENFGWLLFFVNLVLILFSIQILEFLRPQRLKEDENNIFFFGLLLYYALMIFQLLVLIPLMLLG